MLLGYPMARLCPNCRRDLPGNPRVCPECGNAIVAEGSEAFVFGIVWGAVGYALLTSSRAPDQQNPFV